MSGETDLRTLLATMSPQLDDAEYAICTSRDAPPGRSAADCIGWFREAEGTTLILDRAGAEREGVDCGPPMAKITLTVHSSLEAVGFLAAICSRLAAEGISVNPVSAYFHDHLFVPSARAEQAMELLESLSRAAEDA